MPRNQAEKWDHKLSEYLWFVLVLLKFLTANHWLFPHLTLRLESAFETLNSIKDYLNVLMLVIQLKICYLLRQQKISLMKLIMMTRNIFFKLYLLPN